MPAKPLDSSVVAAARYDPEHRLLEVTYHNGKTYYYADVPPDIYDQFINAPSVGKYLNVVIKPNYRAYRMQDGKLVAVGGAGGGRGRRR